MLIKQMLQEAVVFICSNMTNMMSMLYEFMFYMEEQVTRYSLNTGGFVDIDFNGTTVFLDKDHTSLWRGQFLPW